MVTNEETAVIVAPKDNLPEKSSPDSTTHASSTDREGNTSIVPEKPSEDGYNWRKYGQKNVKGNGNIRSYYKCSHPVCQVKKQVERSQDGRITDVIYLGNHDHISLHSDPQTAIPIPLSVKVPDSAPVAADEDKPSDVPSSATDHVEKMIVGELAIVKATDGTTLAPVTPSSQTRNDHGDNLTLKKRKKSVDGADSAEKSNHESRVVVHTVSEVDMVNDGYRWRKYGQKMVKGSPNPRSYYRCSTAGCPVKKHVERASHDFKVVITTYEGHHDHSMPPVRTIVPQSTGASVGGIEPNGSSKVKSEEGDTQKSISVCHATTTNEDNNLAIVVKTDDPISRSTDQEASQAEKTDFIAQTAKKEKVQSAELDKVPETVSTETKPSIEHDLKPETVSIEAKRPDAIIEKSNGLQMPNAEAVNC